ncbi:MAG TPA: methionine--tRNA ligase [Phycisphaerae bacterium]|nr:methionine--tRNA ligase [Phycisphaerae bacterium]HRY68737.1 methionine--tRNA ligase [Phycisphaerae bacterium]HSA29608.1 methionine--tRNA ligase [Phycisphaerae bacterium]
MAQRRFLITSALPYSNGRLHVGHVAGAYLPADTYVRYLRARGEDVRFICGSDDNGVAALIAARKEGKSVEELTTHFNHRQKADFEDVGIHFDVYGGTHQPEYVELHNKISQSFFQVIHDKGYFVKRTTEQLYDVQANQFLPDRYVKGTCYGCGAPGAYGDQCEACGISIDPMQLINPVSTITHTRPEPRKTTHWYLQLGRLEEQLRAWLESKKQVAEGTPAWRDTVLNFSLGQIKQGLPERAMTRDLDWGVPVPLDDPDARGKVLYVWFDAPIGYVSFTAKLCQDRDGDWRNYEKWWKDPDCKIVHFIGEDNTVFHALTWPAVLMAEGGYQLPWQVVANAFLNIKFPGKEEEKISKSRGTAIWIEEYLKIFEADPLRYYLTAIAPESQQTTFDVDDFIARNNGELLNALGNFFNRTLTFANRYFEGKVPPTEPREEIDCNHMAAIAATAGKMTENLEAFRFKAALEDLMALARAGNVYFDAKQPWKQRKDNMAGCGTTINACLQTVKALTVLMAPFLPFSADKAAGMLNLGVQEVLPWSTATEELPAGHPLAEPVILFKKLDAVELFGEATK